MAKKRERERERERERTDERGRATVGLAVIVVLGLLSTVPGTQAMDPLEFTDDTTNSVNPRCNGDTEASLTGAHEARACVDARTSGLGAGVNSDDRCGGYNEYEARAGALGVDPGGLYTASGDGDYVQDKEEQKPYPFSASVADSGARINALIEGQITTVEAQAIADSPTVPKAEVSPSDSAQCGPAPGD